MKLSIVIPVRNEHDTVVQVIERVRAVDCGMEKEAVGKRCSCSSQQAFHPVAIRLGLVAVWKLCR